jgi:hypothetical protein
MKKFSVVGPYSVVAALLLCLGFGAPQTHASEFPTLVDLQAGPAVAREPIVVAAISRVAKSELVRVFSAAEKAALKERTAAQKALDDAIKSGDRQKIIIARANLDAAERKVDLAEAKAKISLAKQKLEEAKQNGASAEQIQALEAELKAAQTDLADLNPTSEESIITSNDVSTEVDVPPGEDPNASPSN